MQNFHLCLCHLFAEQSFDKEAFVGGQIDEMEIRDTFSFLGHFDIFENAYISFVVDPFYRSLTVLEKN